MSLSTKSNMKISPPEAFKSCRDPPKNGWKSEKNEAEVVHEPYKPLVFKAKDNILDCVGYTPLVRLNKIPQSEDVKCNIFIKCEFLNIGGSVKDRISYRMVADAEKTGRIKPGDTLIEATSGNTGIGLAMVGAIKGYRVIITMPGKNSDEKIATMKALGAEVYLTPAEASYDSPESHIALAKRLKKEIPNSHILDQYSNPSNPLAHYDGTAEEILDQLDGKVDYVFIGAGTGGTVTGVGHKFKERNPDCKVICIDPWGSVLALPSEMNESDISTYRIEGTGYVFVPEAIDRRIIDQWIKVGDQDAIPMARRLIKDEGLLVGGSAGQVLAGAVFYCKENKVPEGKNCVVVAPDSIRNYVSNFVNDDWMIRCGFGNLESLSDPKHRLHGVSWETLGLKESKIADHDIKIKDVAKMLSDGQKFIPVASKKSDKVYGYIDAQSLLRQIFNRDMKGDDNAVSAIIKDVPTVPKNTDLCQLSRLLENNNVVIINDSEDPEKCGKLFLVESADLLKAENVI